MAAVGLAHATSRPEGILQLADYVGVDYSEAVVGGRVVNTQEYAEQQEFAAAIRAGIDALPDTPAKAALQHAADALVTAVAERAPAPRIGELTAEIAQGILAHYAVAASPRTPPDLHRGTKLFAQHCTGCHGVDGRGDGAAARGLEPAPTDFHDPDRRDRRSLFSLYNTISLGVAGTAMPAFTDLSEADRWALAAHVAALGAEPGEIAVGGELWRDGKPPARALGTLVALSATTPAGAEREFGADGRAVLSYLRAHPHVLGSASSSGLAFSIAQMEASAAAYHAGQTTEAEQFALAAYLEGFEPAEPALRSVDRALTADIEHAMMRYRELLRSAATPNDVAAAAADIRAQLVRAADRIETAAPSALSRFSASFVILAREGLEAILVLAAMFAFLGKAGRPELRVYVHVGWIAALLVGALTWGISTHLVTMSGASRELTEGVSALAAAAILLYVGYWLHNRSHADAWRRYLHGQLGEALARRRLWLLSVLAFLAVYREAFETVLFYQAVWAQGGHSAVIAGFVAGTVFLAAVGWAITRLSIRLPIKRFFQASAAFVAVLAVVLVGNGVAALQEAGTLPADHAPFVSIPLLGVHPNWQALLAQLTTIGLLAGLFSYRRNPAEDIHRR